MFRFTIKIISYFCNVPRVSVPAHFLLFRVDVAALNRADHFSLVAYNAAYQTLI